MKKLMVSGLLAISLLSQANSAVQPQQPAATQAQQPASGQTQQASPGNTTAYNYGYKAGQAVGNYTAQSAVQGTQAALGQGAAPTGPGSTSAQDNTAGVFAGIVSGVTTDINTVVSGIDKLLLEGRCEVFDNALQFQLYENQSPQNIPPLIAQNAMNNMITCYQVSNKITRTLTAIGILLRQGYQQVLAWQQANPGYTYPPPQNPQAPGNFYSIFAAMFNAPAYQPYQKIIQTLLVNPITTHHWKITKDLRDTDYPGIGQLQQAYPSLGAYPGLPALGI